MRGEVSKREYKRRGHEDARERALIQQREQCLQNGEDETAGRILIDLIVAYQGEAEDVAQELYKRGEDHDEAFDSALHQVQYLIELYEPDEDPSLQEFLSHYLRKENVKRRISRRETGYGSRRRERTNIPRRRLRRMSDARAQQGTDLDVGEALSLLQELVNKLPERLRYIISWRYNLDGRGGATGEEIASELNVSAQRVRQLEQKAIKRLRLLSMGTEILEVLQLEDDNIEMLLKELEGRPAGKLDTGRRVVPRG